MPSCHHHLCPLCHHLCPLCHHVPNNLNLNLILFICLFVVFVLGWRHDNLREDGVQREQDHHFESWSIRHHQAHQGHHQEHGEHGWKRLTSIRRQQQLNKNKTNKRINDMNEKRITKHGTKRRVSSFFTPTSSSVCPSSKVSSANINLFLCF